MNVLRVFPTSRLISHLTASSPAGSQISMETPRSAPTNPTEKNLGSIPPSIANGSGSSLLSCLKEPQERKASAPFPRTRQTIESFLSAPVRGASNFGFLKVSMKGPQDSGTRRLPGANPSGLMIQLTALPPPWTGLTETTPERRSRRTRTFTGSACIPLPTPGC